MFTAQNTSLSLLPSHFLPTTCTLTPLLPWQWTSLPHTVAPSVQSRYVPQYGFHSGKSKIRPFFHIHPSLELAKFVVRYARCLAHHVLDTDNQKAMITLECFIYEHKLFKNFYCNATVYDIWHKSKHNMESWVVTKYWHVSFFLIQLWSQCRSNPRFT